MVYPEKISFKKEGKMHFQIKENLLPANLHSITAKGSSSTQREMRPDGDLGLQERRKHILVNKWVYIYTHCRGGNPTTSPYSSPV